MNINNRIYGDYGVKYEPGYIETAPAVQLTGKRMFAGSGALDDYHPLTVRLIEREVASYAPDQEGRDYAIVEFVDEETDLSKFEVWIHNKHYKDRRPVLKEAA